MLTSEDILLLQVRDVTEDSQLVLKLYTFLARSSQFTRACFHVRTLNVAHSRCPAQDIVSQSIEIDTLRMELIKKGI